MQQLWHLWPHTKRHLYLCIAAVLALYLRTENATPLRVAIIVAVNVLPASAHAPAAVIASMLLPPLDGAALPRYLQILLSRPGLAATAALQLAALSALSNRRWRASLGGERWAPAPRWVARAVRWSRWANVVVFGLFAGEAWGGIGSGRFAADVADFTSPTPRDAPRLDGGGDAGGGSGGVMI